MTKLTGGRYTLLAEKILPLLREYNKKYRPEEYLFEGEGGGQYSERSMQTVVKEALLRANVKKYATVHTLRHSFATHLVEMAQTCATFKTCLGTAAARRQRFIRT